MTPPMTRAEFRESLGQTASLQFWFLWHWLRRHPDESCRAALRQRVDIIRMTASYDPRRMHVDHPDFAAPAWLALETDLVALHLVSVDPDDFAEAACARLAPAVDANLAASFAAANALPAMKCGSLTYHAPDPADPATIAVHIANALRPRSPFGDPRYLPEGLLALMARAEAEYGVSRLHCGSWLNSHPRWLALFPAEWQRNLSAPDPDIQWHLGFWGQFVTARGDFHAANATRFRQTGAMPFAYRTSTCSFANLRHHLTALITTH